MNTFVKNSCPNCGGSLRSWKCDCKPIWDGYTTSDTERASTASAITDEQRQYFVYSPDHGIDWYDSEAEARVAAQEELDYFRKEAHSDGEWSSEVERICWGVTLGKTVAVEMPDEANEDGEVPVDYALAAPTAQPTGHADCPHKWVDARNKVVQSGEFCRNCGVMRAGNAAAVEPSQPAATLDAWHKTDAELAAIYGEMSAINETPRKEQSVVQADRLTVLRQEAVAICERRYRLASSTPAPAAPSPDAIDAGRYRKLRVQSWNRSPLCVVAGGKQAIRLGVDCPRTDRLDALVDALPEEGP